MNSMRSVRASRQAMLMALALMAESPLAQAAEGGLTNYLAGYYGDFAVAVTPAPGLYGYATYYNYRGRTQGPDVPETFALKGALRIAGFQYVTDHSLLGARLAFGAYTTSIAASLASDDPATAFTAEASGRGDSSISPVILYWSAGNLHLSVYEAIILPTGNYASHKPLNLSRNYVSFDSVLALTWLDPMLGLEVSVVPGVMINTRNDATNWRTGVELHADAMLNAWLSQEFAIGLHGYLYQQIEADSGTSAPPGLRSASFGIGPSVMVRTTPLGVEGKLVGKWLHEVDAENRFRGDILSLTSAARF